MLQPTPDGKAIWRATVSSEAGWSHSFTLLRLSPALIWQQGERPESFAGTVTVEMAPEADVPGQPTTGMDEVPDSIETDADSAPFAAKLSRSEPAPADTALAQPKGQFTTDAMDDLLSLFAEPAQEGGGEREQLIQADRNPSIPSTVPSTDADARLAKHAPEFSGSTEPSGEHFIAWLRQGVQVRRLIINDAKALVHTVADTAYLVSPGLFQRYAQEHPKTAFLAKQDNVADWQWVQKRFEKLQLHRKQDNGLNIWTCEVTGPRKSRRLHGYLLDDAYRLFDAVPPNNPYLRVT